MTKFEDRLFDDLMSEHRSTLLQMERPVAARRRAARPVWLTGGAVAATAATAAGFVVFGGGAGAAYAVTDNHDGTVSVAVSKPSGVDGANAALRKLGDHVAVVPVRD